MSYVTINLTSGHNDFCSPRYIEILARKLEKLGGAHYMFLTHKYDLYSETGSSMQF